MLNLSKISVCHAIPHLNFSVIFLILIFSGQAGIDEAELENLLDESAEIFTQNIIQETQVARQQLHDLQERHEAFIKLEKSITELYQMFQVWITEFSDLKCCHIKTLLLQKDFCV